MRKVLLVGLTPPLIGGSQKHIYEIAKRLAKNHNVSILTQKASECSKFAKVIGLEIPKNPLLLMNFVFFIKVFFFFLFSERYDIVHIHENYLFLIAPFINLKAKKLIATAHGCFGFTFFENLILRFIYFSLIKKFTDKIIFVSEQEYLFFKKEIPQARYIPNGVNIPKSRIRKKIANNIVYFGRFHEQKGVGYLLKAFSEIVKKHPQFTLVIIGKENEYSRKLKEIIKSKGISNTKFTGFVSDEKLSEYLISAKMIVLPSLFEGQSIAVLEALASGRPLITTNISANKYLINGKNALLVEPANAEKLASAMRYLIENEDKADKLGREGRKLAKRFDWMKITEKLGEDCYE